MDFYNNVASVLSKKGINLTVGTIYDLMAIWKSWYRGNVNDFHYYTENPPRVNLLSAVFPFCPGFFTEA